MAKPAIVDRPDWSFRETVSCRPREVPIQNGEVRLAVYGDALFIDPGGGRSLKNNRHIRIVVGPFQTPKSGHMPERRNRLDPIAEVATGAVQVRTSIIQKRDDGRFDRRFQTPPAVDQGRPAIGSGPPGALKEPSEIVHQPVGGAALHAVRVGGVQSLASRRSLPQRHGRTTGKDRCHGPQGE